MIMRTDIPEPWKCVGGHDPAVVVHDLPRHSCKSIQKVQKVLFSDLTVPFILHALDSWARRINVVLPSHKHHRHPLRKERCHWNWNCYHGIKHCAFLLRRESCYEGNAHAVPVLLSFHHEKQSNRGSAKKTLYTDQDAKSELVMKAKNKVVRPRSFPLVLPLDEVLTTLRESTNHGHAYIYLYSLSQLAVGI